jgi:hypothetical protein
MQEISETASWLANTALANKTVYRNQALSDRIHGQEKTFKSHGTEQRGTVGGDETLSRDFVAVQGQTCLCHRPNVSLPAGDHNPLRPSRIKLKPFRQWSGYYDKGSASIYRQFKFFGTTRGASQASRYVKQSHLKHPFKSLRYCNPQDTQRKADQTSRKGSTTTPELKIARFHADRKGTPVDLPMGQPTKFDLVINSKAAKQIGLTIPQNVPDRVNQMTEISLQR